MDEVIKENIRGYEILFKTKPGVFSKKGLDEGSRLLAEKMRIEDGSLVADLGCGTGVIGFVAAKLNKNGYVHLLDVDLRIIELVKENKELNSLENVEVFLSDLFSAVGNKNYHLIVSNIPQHLGNKFLTEAAEQCLKYLKDDGEVLWVVQKRIRPFFERLFMSVFGNCEIIARGQTHIVLKAVKK